MTDILNTSNLTKSFGDFTLSGVTLSVAAGGVTGFVGSNGAGKTTTIKLILDLVQPDSGTVTLFGETIEPGHLDPAIKQRIGVVFDSCPFTPELTVADVGRIGSYSYANWDNKQFAQLCESFSLAESKKVKDFSRGMGMKLQLAFAFAHNPQLLILDEATAGLDPLAREEVLELLRAFVSNGENGILISTHITSDLEKIADWIVCINEGALVFTKAIDEVCDIAGIARCRATEAEALVEAGIFPRGSLRVLHRGYSTDILVPDRSVLKSTFPDIACDRPSIEDYMAFALEGDPR